VIATDPHLRELAVLALDCQSTGASPSHGHLLEVGWAHARGQEPHAPAGVSARLVALPEGARIPGAVRRVTGVSDDDMKDALPEAHVWRELAGAIEAASGPPALTVIHFARFEEPFLRQLVARQVGEGAAFPFDIVCTHDIGRRLLPDLPRLGLRALAGYFGRRGEELKRSAGHVEATVFVWHHLLAMLEAQHGVARLSDLRAWLGLAAPSRAAGARAYPMPRPKRLALPDAPGVYRFLDAAGHLLYVGKATSLRRRVNSYFQKQRGVSERALEMLTQARDLDVTAVPSPLEAALLETDEIKRHLPPYNRALVADRRGPWFSDAALRSLAARPSVRRPVGPFGGRAMPRGFGALVRMLAAQDTEPTPAEVRAALPGRSLDGIPDPACFREGLERFVAALDAVDGASRAPAGLLRLGHTMWPQIAASDRDDDDDDDAQDEPSWDPERVGDALVELCARFAHGLRRARWLLDLTEATVVFTELAPIPCVRRVLHVRAGEIVARGHLPIGDPVPIPEGHARSARDRRRVFDLLTHDRLRVLTSELRRVAQGGQDVQIRFGPGAVLEGDRLGRALAWI
jgi:DNA polymerase-3 subunit epsilon